MKGWYKEALTPETREKYNLRRCSICVVDCDLYDSSRLVLKFIEPLISSQSIILFDDWNMFGGDPNKGEQKAFSEFLARNPHIYAEPFFQFSDYGRGFILHLQK